MGPLGLTSRWTAAGRARESARADRLFDDPLAAVLAGAEGFALLDQLAVPGRDNPTFAVRTRFFDDMLIDAVDRGICQVVLVAAGMDARAFRLSWPDRTVLYELDRPEVLAAKQQALDHEQAAPRCTRIPVDCDLTDRWAPPLLAAGYQPDQPAVILAQGLLMYLTEPDVHRLLDQITRLSCAGGVFGADLPSRASLQHPWMAEWLARLAARGMPWQFGSDDPASLLAAHGWQPHIAEFTAVAQRLGRYHPETIPQTIAADIATVSRTYLITAHRPRG